MKGEIPVPKRQRNLHFKCRVAIATGFLTVVLSLPAWSGESGCVTDVLRELTEIPLARLQHALENSLPEFLKSRRWFGGKSQPIDTVRTLDLVSIPSEGQNFLLTITQVKYKNGLSEKYAIPVAVAYGKEAESLRISHPKEIVATLSDGGIVYDPSGMPQFGRGLLSLITDRKTIPGNKGQWTLSGETLSSAGDLKNLKALEFKSLKGEQSNTSTIIGQNAISKIIRRLEEGANPDVEITRFLTERAHFRNSPELLGSLVLKGKDGSTIDLGVLQKFVPRAKDAWSDSLNAIHEQFNEGLKLDSPAFEDFLKDVDKLGVRTAELHNALSVDRVDPNFSPIPMTLEWQKSLNNALKRDAEDIVELLNSRLKDLPAAAQNDAKRVIREASNLKQRLEWLNSHPVGTELTRAHNDYHLGQVLKTENNDFVILDFEGEPARALAERRKKVSPLRDVAGMLRSYHYAVNHEYLKRGSPPQMKRAVEDWYDKVADRFWRAYKETAKNSGFLPKASTDAQGLLDVFLLEKGMYELKYELNNRPDWAAIPIQGLLKILQHGKQ
ncbi:MAG TPA: putative maltokinase [Bdellovibrionota bacterium]|nr:putative maltokinase [Bdellovibrionota bacterium]